METKNNTLHILLIFLTLLLFACKSKKASTSAPPKTGTEITSTSNSETTNPTKAPDPITMTSPGISQAEKDKRKALEEKKRLIAEKKRLEEKRRIAEALERAKNEKAEDFTKWQNGRLGSSGPSGVVSTPESKGDELFEEEPLEITSSEEININPDNHNRIDSLSTISTSEIDLDIPEEALPETLPFEELKAEAETCLINRTQDGVIAFQKLDFKQTIDQPFFFKLALDNISNKEDVVQAIDPNVTDNEIESLNFENDSIRGVNVATLTISTFMSAELLAFDDEAFEIVFNQKSETERQKVNCEVPAFWEWKVTPLKVGAQNLKLKIYLEDDQANITPLPAFERKFNIVAQPKPWYAKAAIPFGLIGVCFLGYVVYQRSLPKEFGSSLGVMGAGANIKNQPTKPKSVFIGYAKKDEEWTERIVNHLKSLDKAGFVDIWYDQMANIGEDYKKQVFEHLNKADIVLLNVSSDFLASDLCDEILEALDQKAKRFEHTTVIPILLRNCLWGTSPIAGLQIYPKNQKPLSDSDWDNPDEAIFAVMTEIESVLL